MIMVMLTYVAVIIFVCGFVYKVWIYAKTPAPFKIPITPAPVSGIGVGGRLSTEVLFFRSLFKSNKWIWFGGYVFHIFLLLVLLRHLRYFLDPVPELVLMVQKFGIYAGLGLSFPLLYLLGRRIFVDRVRYISALSDYFALFLLLGIALSGVWLKFMDRVNVLEVKLFIKGIFMFSPQSFPANTTFYIHFLLILLLLVYFPFSKLMHAVGIFFSPSFNQIDNPREKQHKLPPGYEGLSKEKKDKDKDKDKDKTKE